MESGGKIIRGEKKSASGLEKSECTRIVRTYANLVAVHTSYSYSLPQSCDNETSMLLPDRRGPCQMPLLDQTAKAVIQPEREDIPESL